MEQKSDNNQGANNKADQYIESGCELLFNDMNRNSYTIQQSFVNINNTNAVCILRRLSEKEQEKLKNEIKNKILEILPTNTQQMIFNFKIDCNTKQIKVKIGSRDVVVCDNIPNIVVLVKLQNGKVIEREFSTKENGEQYKVEEIKVILKEVEKIGRIKDQEDGRYDKSTFLSMIVDMDNNLIGKDSKNPIRFIEPDQNNKDWAYSEITEIAKQAQNDTNSPSILLIPYSADGHIVTLLIDKNKFCGKDSVMCFDSSHYFNEYHGIFELFRLSKSLNTKHFSKDLSNALAKQQPINKTRIQGLEGTCSFYTEAFCYIMSDYIRRNPQKTLDDVKSYVNTPDVERLIKYYKNLFFSDYKATMEEVKEKLEMQKDNIKKRVIKQNTTEIRQLTLDEQYYQQLLNQYSDYRYGREFTNDINNLKPFNSEQQNVLVPQYIDSPTLTYLNNGNNIIVAFNNNIRDIVYQANNENSVLNGGMIPVSFIYTLGTQNNQNADAGTHYVAAQIFRNGSTNELVVLHYDSLNGNVDNEFENYIKQEFGNDVQIINIPNDGRFTQREQGANTCGLCALTALRSGGILDQKRVNAVIKYHMSQDTNFNRRNTQTQQTAEQIQLSEVYRGLNIEIDNNTRRNQHEPSIQIPQTPIAPPPSRSSTSTPNIN